MGKMLPPPMPTSVASMAAREDAEMPKKKRRTLRDAEQELDESRQALQDAKRKLINTARENAKMKVLLMKYIDKDDSLLCSSQLSVAADTREQESECWQQVSSTTSVTDPPSTQSTLGTDSQSTALGDSEGSIWTSDFQADDGDNMLGPVSQLSQMSQMSQVSQWSELSSTSNLDEIINFLEKQDTVENERITTLQADFKELQAQKTCVRVGVGVILVSKQHPKCVLIGRRKGSHGAGKFALPGGHLEMFESWEECAIREVKEETGAQCSCLHRWIILPFKSDLVCFYPLNWSSDIDLRSVKFAYVTNDPMEDEGKHYITIFMQATVEDDQVPRNMEPNKCEGWTWEPWEKICTSDNMFMPLYHITRSDFTPAFI